MNDSETGLIVASRRDLPTFEMNAPALIAKKEALERAALIGKVTDLDSKTIAVRSQQELKKLISSFEKARVELNEPLLKATRQLKAMVDAEKLDMEREYGRVSNVVTEFDNAERQRVLEEERLQREELARIEREKQNEIDRLAREQAAREAKLRFEQQESERKVRDAAEAATKLAAAATNKKQREAAEKARIEAEQVKEAARIESERQELVLREQQATLQAQTAAIEERAGDAAYVAAKPVEITKVIGQITSVDWEITKINEWALMKARPDLVRKIEFDMRAIKDELKRGVKLTGVEAKEVHKAGVRLPAGKSVINI